MRTPTLQSQLLISTILPAGAGHYRRAENNIAGDISPRRQMRHARIRADAVRRIITTPHYYASYSPLPGHTPLRHDAMLQRRLLPAARHRCLLGTSRTAMLACRRRSSISYRFNTA